MPHPDSPVENFTGWGSEPYKDTQSDPIQCDSEVDEDAISQYRTYHYGVGDVEMNPIFINSDMDNGTTPHLERGEFSRMKEKRGPFDMNTVRIHGELL
jgi:hypothetical protein